MHTFSKKEEVADLVSPDMPLLRVVNESVFPFFVSFEVMSRPMRVMRLMMTHPKALVARRKSSCERPDEGEIPKPSSTSYGRDCFREFGYSKVMSRKSNRVLVFLTMRRLS